MKKERRTRVETLIEQAETTSNATLKAALVKHAEEESRKEEAMLIAQFEEASKILNNAVGDLIAARKREKYYKSNVSQIDKAMEQFKKDGKYENFLKVIQKINRSNW